MRLNKVELVDLINNLSELLDIDNDIKAEEINDRSLHEWNRFLNTYRVKKRFTMSDLIIPQLNDK